MPGCIVCLAYCLCEAAACGISCPCYCLAVTPPATACLQINFTSVTIINGFSQIVLAIYSFMGSISMGQIETVLEKVLLRQAEGEIEGMCVYECVWMGRLAGLHV